MGEGDGVAVDELLGLLLGEYLAGLAHGHLAVASAAGHQLLEHVLEVHVQLVHAHGAEDLHGHGVVLVAEFDGAFVQLTGPELLA